MQSTPVLRVPRALGRVLLAAATVVAAAVGATAPALADGPRIVRPVVLPAAPAPGRVAAIDSSHPYSAPVWLPLRKASAISCVKSNCAGSGGDYHGYWAIDFIGDLGEPVYAAGAGVFHVGATSRTCSTSGQSDGTWGWVDHGGGVVTKYTHLDSLTVAEGTRVTPSTQIGRMGHWGDTLPCTTNYLHFEVREGGIKGTRVEPRILSACTAYGRADYPKAFGVSSFDSLVKGQSSTVDSTNACIASPWVSTPTAPRLSVTRQSSSAQLSWGTPPAGTTTVRIATQLWSPSLSAWNDPVYRTYGGTTTGTTLTSLTNGRTYRTTVAFANASGFSAWAPQVSYVPASVPSVPKSPRFLTSPTRDYIHYGWWKSTDNGAAVSRYETQVRCYYGTAWKPWTTRTTNASTYYYNHRGLTGYQTCQVRVRAVNAMGASAWSAASQIRKQR